MTYRIETYKAPDGWRWRMKAVNGRIVADSAEAYKTRQGCEAAALRIEAAQIKFVPHTPGAK